MLRIQISDTLEALIDNEDEPLILGWEWRPLQTDSDIIYAHAWRRQLHVYMHRLIAGAAPNEKVDHANLDGLDNRKNNLRIASISENQANVRKVKLGRQRTSDYKGVCWDKSRQRWAAYISNGQGGRRYLGRYVSEVDAAHIYDRAALALWGSFARLNFEGREESACLA